MTVNDLLLKLLDYLSQWSQLALRDSLPVKIRLQQIESLQSAFRISKGNVNSFIKVKYFFSGQNDKLDRAKYLDSLSNIEYLVRGEFLKDRSEECYLTLSKKIFDTIKLIYPDLSEDIIKRRHPDVEWLFNDLLIYREKVYKLTYPWSGMLEGFSSGLHYSKHLQSELNKLIDQNIKEIDQTICEILDPDNQEIDLDTLVKNYGYRNVDLDKIDLEWRMENY